MADLRIKMATGPTILLASGHYFDLLDAAGSRFTLGDIAAGLAKTCRFAGQCRSFYSVAQHSVHASYLVPHELALAALMHDAAEAFIGDVTRPLKSLLPDYREIEKAIERAVFDRFDLGDLPYADEVKQADLRMLAAEQQLLMPAHADSWSWIADVEPIMHKQTLDQLRWPYSPIEAERKWLLRFESITGRHAYPDLEHLSEVL